MGHIFDLLWAVVFRKLFWISPKVRRKGPVLLATSSWRTHLFTLGAYSRAVMVDTNQRAVRVRSRRFWFAIKWRRFPFDAIRSVVYGYVDMAPGTVTSALSAYQSDDVYTVALKLADGSEFALFRFYGPGDFVNESFLPDWCYWEDKLEAAITRGPQDSESLVYASTVSQLIGVPLDGMEPWAGVYLPPASRSWGFRRAEASPLAFASRCGFAPLRAIRSPRIQGPMTQ